MKSFAQWCGAKTFTSMREVEIAQQAWDYQQDKIESLEDELHCVRAYNDELAAELHRERVYNSELRERIVELEIGLLAFAEEHPKIPDWVQESARDLLADGAK